MPTKKRPSAKARKKQPTAKKNALPLNRWVSREVRILKRGTKKLLQVR